MTKTTTYFPTTLANELADLSGGTHIIAGQSVFMDKRGIFVCINKRYFFHDANVAAAYLQDLASLDDEMRAKAAAYQHALDECWDHDECVAAGVDWSDDVRAAAALLF